MTEQPAQSAHVDGRDKALLDAINRTLERFERRLYRKVETIMAAIDDAKAAVAALVAEDSAVVAGLDDLAAKVKGGTASEADVQAVADSIKAEVARVDAALQADDPTPVVPPVVPPTG